jgi:hypothetical protein
LRCVEFIIFFGEEMKENLWAKMIPPERMNENYPWQLWASGWIAFFKLFLWLVIEASIYNQIFGYKNLLCSIPFFVFGIGVWNMRKWAAWGVTILSIIDLIFFIMYPLSVTSMIFKGPGILSYLSCFAVMLSGPAGSFFIIISLPVMLKYSKKQDI